MDGFSVCPSHKSADHAHVFTALFGCQLQVVLCLSWQLKLSLKSGGCHAQDRAPPVELCWEGCTGAGKRAGMQTGPGQLAGVNAAEHQTPLGFRSLVAYSTGGLLGTGFSPFRRAGTLHYSPGGANLCPILEIRSLVEQL